METSTVTSKGQITIPKRVREAIGLRPGEQIVFKKTEQGFLVQKQVKSSPFDKYRGYLADVAETDSDEIVRDLRGHK